MKKTIRILSLVTVFCLMASLLSGCKKIDDLRNGQAFWKNEKKQEIIFKDKEYKILPFSEYFSPDFSKGSALQTGRVTKKDVPVLLSNMLGDGYHISENGELINTFSGEYFARSDVYQKYKDQIENYTFSKLGYQKIVNAGNYIIKSFLFNDDEAYILTAAVLSAQKIYESKGEKETTNFLSVMQMDETMAFKKEFLTVNFNAASDEITLLVDGKEYEIDSSLKESVKSLVLKYGNQ